MRRNGKFSCGAFKEFVGYAGGQALWGVGNPGLGSGGPTAKHVDSQNQMVMEAEGRRCR